MAKPKKEVATVETGGVPAYLQNYKGRTGAEDIAPEDMSIPRIKLAQGLTEEVKAGTVPDGALFLNISGEVLAAPGEPLRFTPIAQGKEFILWNPQRGEGIIARGKRVHDAETGTYRYMWDKQDQTFEVKFKDGPKVKWSTKKFVDENGMDQWGSRIPGDDESGIAATAHHNYVVALPDHGGMVAALSLSRSQVKRAKDLNALLNLNAAPIFSRIFEVKTVGEKNDDGEFFNYKFVPAGFVETEADFETFKALHENFVEEGFTVDQSDEDNSDASTEAGTSI